MFYQLITSLLLCAASATNDTTGVKELDAKYGSDVTNSVFQSIYGTDYSCWTTTADVYQWILSAPSHYLALVNGQERVYVNNHTLIGFLGYSRDSNPDIYASEDQFNAYAAEAETETVPHEEAMEWIKELYAEVAMWPR